MCFSCRYLTLAPETADETYVEVSDTEPEDTATSASMTDYPSKGKIYTITWYISAYLPSCSLERLFEPIHLAYDTFKNQTAMIPTSQQNFVLLSYRCSAIA